VITKGFEFGNYCFNAGHFNCVTLGELPVEKKILEILRSCEIKQSGHQMLEGICIFCAALFVIIVSYGFWLSFLTTSTQ
jgi:hypothetical protein